MLEKFRAIICFLLILTSNATLTTLAVNCSSNGDCPERYYCDNDTCKKCLSCSLLFRKGNFCIVDFNECGDCLPGYEEISITVNSVIKKPCKLVTNNKTVAECSMGLNPKSCPPNNYCSGGSCIKCFDCSVVNRLPPANNCAKGLTECGSCRNGYQEVSVTTLTNSKPCDQSSVKVVKSEVIQTFEELIFIGVGVFLMLTLILCAYIKRNSEARGSNKSISICEVIPSAPPLHVMLEDQEREIPLKKWEIKREERQIEYPTLSYEKEQMQQAKVFQQPNAAYYCTDVERPHDSSIENQPLEMDVRRLSLQLGINTIRGFPFSHQLNETVSQTDSSLIVDLAVMDGVPNNSNTNMELAQLDISDLRIFSTAQHPSEMNVECEDPGNAESRCDDSSVTHGESYSNVSVKYVTCSTIQEDNLWFLQDNNLPQWISELVNNSNWTKGKLNCPNCQGRLGSFDFVSGTQCQCGSHVLPPVHIVKCKVDCRNQG